MLFMLGMVSGVSVVGVVVLVCILMDMMKKLRTIENKLTETKAQLRYVKDHSDYKAYREMKESNDIASETIDDLTKWGFEYKDAYESLVKRYEDLEEMLNEVKERDDANLLDYANLTRSFVENNTPELIDEFDLCILNSYRVEDGLEPMTLEEYRNSEEYYM